VYACVLRVANDETVIRMSTIAGVAMPAATFIEPGLEFVVTVTLIVADIARSTAFYRDVLPSPTSSETSSRSR
jgi:hypothetical protein